MKLLTKEILRKFPKLYANENKNPRDVKIIAKFFTPWAGWTWYATEYDPEKKLFFGLVKGFEKELGYFSLSELESVRGPMGLTIERDRHWRPKTLQEIAPEMFNNDEQST